jgi:hypothetical protein
MHASLSSSLQGFQMPWIYERNERMMVPFQSHKRGEREKAASRDSKSPPEAQGSVPLRCTPRFLTSTICFSLISSLSGMHFAHLPWQILGSAVSTLSSSFGAAPSQIGRSFSRGLVLASREDPKASKLVCFQLWRPVKSNPGRLRQCSQEQSYAWRSCPI